jgi:signal transduction histidine kinase
MPPVRWGGWKLRRQYIAVAAVFAVLLVVSFASFARLMMGQLSRSYMEDVLLSGKAQAEELARQLRGQGNLYKAVETQREALSQISAALSRQQVIDKVQVFNEQGKLVWQSEFVTEGVKGGFPEGNLELLVPISPVKVTEKTKTYQFRARPDEVGTVVLSVSKPAIAARIAILHRKLLVNTAFAGGTSLLVLIGAIVFIWHLVQRNAQLDDKRRLHEELAALGSLAANLAHEIRNPLKAISINLELLEEDLGARQTPVETVGMARREVGRLSRLVNDFLVYARPSLPAPEAFDAGVLLHDVAALLAPTCDRLGVELVVGGGGVPVWGDRGQLSQVLMNLALNAVQAMDGCAIRRVELSARGEGDRAVFEVTDTGPGIVKTELGRVREAFFTRRKGGTGLGLAIADRIVIAHGGSLALANRPGGGLVATVTVPAPE